MHTAPESQYKDDYASREAPEPGTPPSPWNVEDFYPSPPAQEEPGWGYTVDKVPYGCTLDELRSYVGGDRSKRIKLVWTPRSSRMVPPEEVPELLHDVRHRDLLFTRKQLNSYLLTAVLWSALAVFNYSTSGARTDTPFIAYFILPLVLGIIPAAQTGWALWRMRTREATWEESVSAGQNIRYQDWLGRHRAPFSLTFIFALLLVGLVQIYTSMQHMFDGIFNDRPGGTWSAIDAAGLVKSAVWEGDVWRLLTGTVLHASIWHFFFNVLVLYAYGKVVEVLVGQAYLPIVFLFSALAGSVFSLLLLPATSVGSSGGIMGVIGFLGVLGYYNRPNVPPGFLRSILGVVALVGVFGLVAFAFVDNAAHAGGLLCGALVGYILLPHRPTPLPVKPNSLVNGLGVLCTLCLLGGVLGSIIAMFTWP
ncbi:MAG TPA: rhomboid family intramembrane serine protease [Chloroflexia bacterium]|nr:rhomboid family intramembrane serine protease [Chloroflexia bacterium]